MSKPKHLDLFKVNQIKNKPVKPYSIYPTMESLPDAIAFAQHTVKVDKNTLLLALFTYHNTILKVLSEES